MDLLRPIIPVTDSYDACMQGFAWAIPARLNMGVLACDLPAAADADAPALIVDTGAGDPVAWSRGDLLQGANRLANALTALGVRRGDRVAVHLPQRTETVVTYLAVLRMGAVAMPLSVLFGPDGMAYRLGDSGAAAIVTSAAGIESLGAIRSGLPDLRTVISIDGVADGALAWDDVLAAASDAFTPADTSAEDPALLVYTSGTTGMAKGALHAHRTIIGHLSGMDFILDFWPQPGDLYWSPADWAWMAGLMDVLMPSLVHGVPVLIGPPNKGGAPFDAEAAFGLMARNGVRNAFLPPTALKMMRGARDTRPEGLALRSVFSGGEAMGAALLDWGRAVLGVTVNEAYGQTEANVIVGNNAAIMPVKPGSMGRPLPGHDVAVIGEDGARLPPGAPGEIAVRSPAEQPDPVVFVEYWKRPEATAEKMAGGWCRTGDFGRVDEDGYIWFESRSDDLINSGGYRIGPAEVEDCLMRHPAVAMAGVVGKPDAARGEIVKAFVVVAEGHMPGDALAEELKAFVKARLAAHEYPREVAFLDALPLTVTGKIRRVDLKAMEGRLRPDAINAN